MFADDDKISYRKSARAKITFEQFRLLIRQNAHKLSNFASVYGKMQEVDIGFESLFEVKKNLPDELPDNRGSFLKYQANIPTQKPGLFRFFLNFSILIQKYIVINILK